MEYGQPAVAGSHQRQCVAWDSRAGIHPLKYVILGTSCALFPQLGVPGIVTTTASDGHRLPNGPGHMPIKEKGVVTMPHVRSRPASAQPRPPTLCFQPISLSSSWTTLNTPRRPRATQAFPQNASTNCSTVQESRN